MIEPGNPGWSLKLSRGGGGGGGTFHTYVGLGHFFGFKILNFNIFLGFQKKNIFWGMKIFWGH